MTRSSRLLRHIVLLTVAGGSVGAQTPKESDSRWQFYTEGFIASSPAIGADGTVYITATLPGTPASGRVFAITPRGDVRWPGPARYFPVDAAVDASPALSPDGGTLYFGAYNGKLYALDALTGAKRWEVPIDVDNPLAVIASSPAVASNGTIYVGAGDGNPTEPGWLLQVTPSGTVSRRARVNGSVDSTPAIGRDGTIYFGSWDHRIYALRPEDLSEKWSVLASGPVLSSPAIGADGTIYIGAQGSGSVPGGVFALTPAGAVKWHYRAGNVVATPTLGADGTIYFGSVTTGKFYALNPDGTEKWNFDVGHPVLSSAAVRADGTIIFGADRDRGRGRVYALNPDSSVRWVRDLDGAVDSSPAIAPDGTIYVGSDDRNLHAIYGNGSPLSIVSSWPMFGRDVRHSGRATPASDTRLVNLSTRALAGPGANLITGFVAAGGATSKYFLVRGIGPSLAQFGVLQPLRDPTITLYAQVPAQVLAFNDDWGDRAPPGPTVEQATAVVGAFPLPAESKDAAVVPLLSPGLYTAVVGSADGASGTALVEVYDPVPDEPGSRLVNLSTLGHVGADTLVPGLVIRGTNPLRVLVRAVGPGLAQFPVQSELLARPRLTVYSGQTAIDSNAHWITHPLRGDIVGAERLTGAFALRPGDADSATVVTLTPGSNSFGSFTIEVSGVNGSRGHVLVEIYVIP